ncbi:hypothetical protein GWC77_27625 [Paraburkholderia sp. NMBU_R16]|nr:hypothetical protein [Paraburkholderia sp. NMBU_R16]
MSMTIVTGSAPVNLTTIDTSSSSALGNSLAQKLQEVGQILSSTQGSPSSPSSSNTPSSSSTPSSEGMALDQTMVNDIEHGDYKGAQQAYNSAMRAGQLTPTDAADAQSLLNQTKPFAAE